MEIDPTESKGHCRTKEKEIKNNVPNTPWEPETVLF